MKTLKIAIVILWMLLIFLFSNQPASDSSKLSDGLILKTVRIIEKITNKNYNDKEILNKFVKPIRKLAHFTIYLVLGIFVILLLKEYNLTLSKQIIISILICILYAISDEIHQLFIDGRSCELLDVFIDLSGSFIGINLMNINKIHNFK